MRDYRFFYRDLDEITSRNRRVATRFADLMRRGESTVIELCRGLVATGDDAGVGARDRRAGLQCRRWCRTYWMSFQRIGAPHGGGDAERRCCRASLDRAAYQVLALIAPYLVGDGRALIERWARIISDVHGGRDGEEVDQISARRQGLRLRRGRTQEALGAAASRRLRAVPEGGRGRSTRGATFTPANSGRRSRPGIAAGGAGINAAVKAQTVYAHYLEKTDKAKLALFEEAAGWADERRGEAPKDANAHYLYAFALGRYSQGISVAKALAQGFGGKIKDALLTALKLEAKHADAHIAYGSYQAEVIGKVGGIVAGMTYGAKKDSALEHFEKAVKLFPESAIARIEYANGLILLFGKGRLDEATTLYEEAAAVKPLDAMERLDVELAKSELE